VSVDVVIHTLGWTNDHATREGEEPTSLLHSIVEINGQIVPGAMSAKIEAEGGDFASVTIVVGPTSAKMVSCTPEEWAALGERYDAA
jgi:hypothetical protein